MKEFSARGFVTVRHEVFFYREAPDLETAVIEFAQGIYDNWTTLDRGDLEQAEIRLNTIEEETA